MASIVSDMFSATAAVAIVSAIHLSNSFTNLDVEQAYQLEKQPSASISFRKLGNNTLPS